MSYDTCPECGRTFPAQDSCPFCTHPLSMDARILRALTGIEDLLKRLVEARESPPQPEGRQPAEPVLERMRHARVGECPHGYSLASCHICTAPDMGVRHVGAEPQAPGSTLRPQPSSYRTRDPSACSHTRTNPAFQPTTGKNVVVCHECGSWTLPDMLGPWHAP